MAQKIITAICSFGMSGKLFHAPFLHAHPGFELYAVWERTTKQVQQYYPSVISCQSLQEILTDPLIQLVVVNTPNSTHYAYAKAALQAGKHVLVEKPFVTTTTEGEELIALAKDKGLTLSVYHNRRYDSDVQTIKGILDKKMLGNVVEAEFHFDRFKDEVSPKQHKEMPGPGAGILFDLGSHVIDTALYLFGMPQAVFGDVTILRPVSQVEDYFEVLLYYPTKRVRLKGTYQAKELVPSFIVHGSNGSFIKTRADVQEADLLASKVPGSAGWGIEPIEEQGLLHTTFNGEIIRQKVPTQAGNYATLFENLYQAIMHKKQLPENGEAGLAVIQIIEAALQSSKEKCVVSIEQNDI